MRPGSTPTREALLDDPSQLPMGRRCDPGVRWRERVVPCDVADEGVDASGSGREHPAGLVGLDSGGRRVEHHPWPRDLGPGVARNREPIAVERPDVLTGFVGGERSRHGFPVPSTWRPLRPRRLRRAAPPDATDPPQAVPSPRHPRCPRSLPQLPGSLDAVTDSLSQPRRMGPWLALARRAAGIFEIRPGGGRGCS